MPRRSWIPAALIATLWAAVSLARAEGDDVPAAPATSPAMPMGALLKTPPSPAMSPRQNGTLTMEQPRVKSRLEEPSPLFPTVMGPLPPQPLPAGIASLSAQTCSACHLENHRQWRQSGHAAAWIDPLYQAAWQAAGRANACIHCHIPLTEQQPQRIVGWIEGDASLPRLEDNPLFEPALQEEGVTCAVCHVRDGTIFGTRTLAPGRAPHPVVAHPDLRRPELCGACHQLALPGATDKPFYDTLGEWSRSSWGAAAITCQDCHMPWEMASSTRSQGAAAPRRSHLMAGGKDDETVLRALTLTLRSDKASYLAGETIQLEVRVMNTGAGHAVPTTAPFRRILIQGGALGADGAVKVAGQAVLERRMAERPPFEELSDDRLQADGTLSVTIPIVIPAKAPTGPFQVAVDVIYQAVPDEVARAHGLDPSMTRRQVLRRTATLAVK